MQALKVCYTQKKNDDGRYLQALLPDALSIDETSSLAHAAIHWLHPSNMISAIFTPFWDPQQQCYIFLAPHGSTLLPVYTIKEFIEETMRSAPLKDAAYLLGCFLSLPAAAQLSGKDAMELLVTAAALSTMNLQPFVGALLERLRPKLLSLPADTAAHAVPSEQLPPLLLMLLEAGGVALHSWLLKLAVAKQLSGETVGQLLHGAVNRGLAAAVPLLLKLPGAQQLTSSTLSVLLVCAVERSMYWAIDSLAQTTAGQQLSGGELVKPLQLSIETSGASATTTCLLKLPGLQLLPSDSVVQLLQSALSAVGGPVQQISRCGCPSCNSLLLRAC